MSDVLLDLGPQIFLPHLTTITDHLFSLSRGGGFWCWKLGLAVAKAEPLGPDQFAWMEATIELRLLLEIQGILGISISKLEQGYPTLSRLSNI